MSTDVNAELEAEFQNRFLNRAGIQMLNITDALLYIRRCEEFGIPILGIDGFIIAPNKTQPMMEHSIDLSSPGFGGGHRSAINFLTQRSRNDFFYEVITGDV